MDDLQILDIHLYFPMSLALSESEFKQIRHKKLICTVEVRRFGRTVVLKENNLVRSLRVVFMRDADTLDWMDWLKFLPSVGIEGRKMLIKVQEAITKEVINGLGLTPARVDPRLIVPRDILTEAT